MDSSRVEGSTPSPMPQPPWGSMSVTRTRYPSSAKQAPSVMVDVVLPTPPFWLAKAITRPARVSAAAVEAPSDAGERISAPGCTAPPVVFRRAAVEGLRFSRLVTLATG